MFDPTGNYGAEQNPEGDVSLLVVIGAAAVGALVKDYVHTPFDREFDEIERLEGIGSDLLRAIARQESNFNPAAVGPPNSNGTRDHGLMQINDQTARRFGWTGAELVTSRENPSRTVILRSLTVAARLLKSIQRELGDRQNIYTVIASYNAGSPAIKRRGIFNLTYAQAVFWNLQMYQLGSLVRGKGGA